MENIPLSHETSKKNLSQALPGTLTGSLTISSGVVPGCPGGIPGATPSLSNTGGATRKYIGQGEKDYTRISGGVDTLNLWFYVTYDCWYTVDNPCKHGKAQAQASGGDSDFEMGGLTWLIAPRGVMKRSYMPYRVTRSGITFILGEPERTEGRRNARGEVFVEFSNEALLRYGVQGCYDSAERLLGLVGASIISHKISRVDLAVDVPDIDVETFTSLRKTHVVTRAQKRLVVENDYRDETVQFGKGDVVLRIYDKLEELKAHKLDSKRDLLQRVRWKGNPEIVTRFEYQIRRPFLKAIKVDTIENLNNRLPDIVRYLVTEWFRIAAVPVDRVNRNQDKVEIHPLWSLVSCSFESVYGGSSSPVVPFRSPVSRNDKGLVAGAVGCLLSAWAMNSIGQDMDEGLNPDDCLNSFLPFMFDYVSENWHKLKGRYKLRLNKYKSMASEG